ncbi:uncharacterized protein LOC114405929 [Glycine soja]|uniref:EF-hand domain-containing protein n=1 Tax=Glycine soja TaxID=3848 RepID=A0A0B2RWP8_GLYSO|nr:uncharacterized protein LOC114405929 [Glycine soja]KHN38821.1 hypothetical protein glysoja_041135 [Glycine soja]RZC18913.1 hypothetical protein D0Y65_005942 [Glycine soja]
MAERETSESEDPSSSGSEYEDAQTVEGNGVKKKKGLSEYEKQRMSRIAENRARLEALGLPQIASSLKGSSQPHKATKGKEKKKKVKDDDDEEYEPEEDEGEQVSGSSSEENEDRKDEDFAIENASGSRKRKVKNKSLKKKARVSGKKHVSNSEYIDYDDDEALRQAIALSLQDSAEGSYLPDKNVVNTSKTEKKGSGHVQEDKGRKNKKSFASRLQLTEDELIVHFFQLDEAGKGTISVRDIQRAATAHDFLWTDKELVDMIRYFDSDGDGKLSLDDFRKIVVRCNLIKGS